MYETASAIWKHEAILGRVTNGHAYISILFALMKTNMLLAIKPDEDMLTLAHDLAVRNRAHPHDMVFVALALRTGLELKSLDEEQLRIMEKEASRGLQTGPLRKS